MMMPNVSILLSMGSHCVCRTRTTCGSGDFDQVRRSYFTFSLTNIACLHWRKMVEPTRGGVSGAIAILGMILTSGFPQVLSNDYRSVNAVACFDFLIISFLEK